MPKEREIIRIAASLIREYGDQANLEAVRRMNAVVETGDLEAQPDSRTQFPVDSLIRLFISLIHKAGKLEKSQ